MSMPLPWYTNNQPVRHWVGTAKNHPGLQKDKKLFWAPKLMPSFLPDVDVPALVSFWGQKHQQSTCEAFHWHWQCAA